MTDTAGQDVAEENPNLHYREALTVWGQTISAQVRGLATMVLYHKDDAPRSSEDGYPFELPTLDMLLLRDLLNAATARGFLPRPEGTAAEDAAGIGSRPTYVEQVRRAYEQGKADAAKQQSGRGWGQKYEPTGGQEDLKNQIDGYPTEREQ